MMLQTRSNEKLTKAPRSRVYSGLGASFLFLLVRMPRE